MLDASPLYILNLMAIILLMLDSLEHLYVHEKLAHKHSHRHDNSHHKRCNIGLNKSVRHSHFHGHEALEHKHSDWLISITGISTKN